MTFDTLFYMGKPWLPEAVQLMQVTRN